jgi:hypothetical protein
MIIIRISQSISPQTWYNQAAGQSLPDVVTNRPVMASTPPMTSHCLSQQLVAACNRTHSLPPCAPSYLSVIAIEIQSP